MKGGLTNVLCKVVGYLQQQGNSVSVILLEPKHKDFLNNFGSVNIVENTAPDFWQKKHILRPRLLDRYVCDKHY